MNPRNKLINEAKTRLRSHKVGDDHIGIRLLCEKESLNWDRAIEAVHEYCSLLEAIDKLQSDKECLKRELTWVCQRNTLLVDELGQRGRKFLTTDRTTAMLKAMYESEG